VGGGGSFTEELPPPRTVSLIHDNFTNRVFYRVLVLLFLARDLALLIFVRIHYLVGVINSPHYSVLCGIFFLSKGIVSG
jgi:hypothetical protein